MVRMGWRRSRPGRLALVLMAAAIALPAESALAADRIWAGAGGAMWDTSGVNWHTTPTEGNGIRSDTLVSGI